MWFPEVMQSTPQAKISSLRSVVIPNRSAAFSTLGTTKSIFRRVIRRGSWTARIWRPARPFTSPIRVMRTPVSGGIVDGAGLADDADLHRSRDLHLLLDAGGDLLRQRDDVAVVHRPGFDQDADFLARAHGVGPAHAVERRGDRLQAAQALHEVLQIGVLLAGSGDDRLLGRPQEGRVDRRLGAR